MPEYQPDIISPMLSEFNTKLRDLEEKQKLLKEKVLLIGHNLIEIRDVLLKDISELKLITEILKKETDKIKEQIINIELELEKRARKSELDLLTKQAKMFQPLNFVRVEELRNKK